MTPKVSYFYDEHVGEHKYDERHPMKPFRVHMTHDLVMNYELQKSMTICRAVPATALEMTQFHTDEYIEYLRDVTPETVDLRSAETDHYNINLDTPVFDGLYDFSSMSAGGSIEGAARLNEGLSDIAINWSGGLHHAKKSYASGFCYVNDIVLGILELLRFHQRVLYIDIDVHHGDGVEEAFYTTDRVMCLSLHKGGGFFPGTGDINDVGYGRGKCHSVNVPLRDGMNDQAYAQIFQPTLDAIIRYFNPEAIVLQCGADSLSGDLLGAFNLSMAGHAKCVSYVQSKGLPTLVLGGGGYTVKNVARTWAKETGVILNAEMKRELPYNAYYEWYGPSYVLDVEPSNAPNMNSKQSLHKMLSIIVDNLRSINAVPSVQMRSVPMGMAGNIHEMYARLDDEDEDDNPNIRETLRRMDQRITSGLDLMNGDDESDDYRAAYLMQPREKRLSGLYADEGCVNEAVDMVEETSNSVGSSRGGTTSDEEVAMREESDELDIGDEDAVIREGSDKEDTEDENEDEDMDSGFEAQGH